MNRSCCLALSWLVALTGCHSVEQSLLYHPKPSQGENLCQGPTPAQDLTLVTHKKCKIHAQWWSHPRGRGAILYCPGNAGNLESRIWLVQELRRNLEESVLIFDYPGYGRSEGKPSEPDCYAAVDAAYRWLTEVQGIPPDRIIVYGESLGGGVAVNLASRKPHRALVLNRTFTSAPDVAEAQLPLLPVHWFMTNRFDNLQKIPHCTRPIFIAQADQDRLIPFSHGRKLRDASRVPTQLFVLEGLGHNDLVGPSFYAALREFLNTQAPLPEEN